MRREGLDGCLGVPLEGEQAGAEDVPDGAEVVQHEEPCGYGVAVPGDVRVLSVVLQAACPDTCDLHHNRVCHVRNRGKSILQRNAAQPHLRLLCRSDRDSATQRGAQQEHLIGVHTRLADVPYGSLCIFAEAVFARRPVGTSFIPPVRHQQHVAACSLVQLHGKGDAVADVPCIAVEVDDSGCAAPGAVPGAVVSVHQEVPKEVVAAIHAHVDLSGVLVEREKGEDVLWHTPLHLCRKLKYVGSNRDSPMPLRFGKYSSLRGGLE